MTAWNPWSPEEEALLRKHWGNGEPTKTVAALFPGRSASAVLKHGYDMELGPRECRRECFSPVWEGIKRALAGGAKMTANELAAHLKVSAHAVTTQLEKHHGTEVRVGGYASVHKSPAVNRWVLGAGRDATKPRRKTKQEINRAYSRRKWKDPEWAARQTQRARLLYAEKSGKLIRPDAATQWLKVVPQHHAEPLRPEHYRDTASSTPAQHFCATSQ